MFTKTKKTDITSKWASFGKYAPEKAKDSLIERFLSEYTNCGLSDVAAIFNSWNDVEKCNAVAGALKSITLIKEKHQDISVYLKASSWKITEIIFSSSPYTKEIYDFIVETFMDYEDLTNRAIDYFYIDKEKLTDSITKDFVKLY